jgi:hypothetical protein
MTKLQSIFILVVVFVLGFGTAALIIPHNDCVLYASAERVAVAHRGPSTKIPITLTVYNPTPAQTDASPFHTADGSFINPKHPQRWCAVSRDLLKLFGYGAKIWIQSGDCPYINGLWEIHDTGGMNGKKRCVDLLISNPHVVRFGGCWKGEIVL